jgi:hypothetical protein
MDAKQELRALIELLLLEGCPGEETPIGLHNVYGEATTNS